MKGHFEVDSTYDEDAVIQNLKVLLEDAPETLLIIQAWETKEDSEEKLLGSMVALAPRGANHVFLFLIRVEKEAPVELKKKFFHFLEHWAEELGRKELRGETVRGCVPYLQEWNFTPVSVIMTRSAELVSKNTDEGEHR